MSNPLKLVGAFLLLMFAFGKPAYMVDAWALVIQASVTLGAICLVKEIE